MRNASIRHSETADFVLVNVLQTPTPTIPLTAFAVMHSVWKMRSYTVKWDMPMYVESASSDCPARIGLLANGELLEQISKIGYL
jgi:hypothetical protein